MATETKKFSSNVTSVDCHWLISIHFPRFCLSYTADNLFFLNSHLPIPPPVVTVLQSRAVFISVRMLGDLLRKSVQGLCGC